MLLDDVPNWEGTPKLGSVSYWARWARWARFFALINIHTGRYNVYKAYILISTPLGHRERMDGIGYRWMTFSWGMHSLQ